MTGALGWIKIGLRIFEAVVRPWLRAHKESKRAKKAEAIATVIIKGVDSYSDVIKGIHLPTVNPAIPPAPAPSVKEIVTNVAKAAGVYDDVEAFVHRVTGKITDKLK